MGGSASRAFAEWQRETTLPESGLKSKGWARVKAGLRVLGVSWLISAIGWEGRVEFRACRP